jgi:hypothetical protein
MKGFVYALFLCFSITGLAQEARNADAARSLTALQRTLIGQSQSLAEAEKSRDLSRLRRLLADDFHQVGSEGSFQGKDEILGDAEEGNLKDYSFYDFRVLSMDENVAIVTYNAVIRKPGGDDGDAPRYQRFSDVWVNDGTQWRIRFQQATAKRAID